MKDKKFLFGIILVFIFLFSVGMTYAYFIIEVTGNKDAKEIVTSTASLLLKYVDGPEVVLKDVFPGAYLNKEVKVENIGSIPVTYAIGFVDMENEITNNELVISYTCKSYLNYGEEDQIESGNCYDLEEQPIGMIDQSIEEGIYMGLGITHVYNIKIEFLETNSDQNYNQNKTFSGIINIGETTDAFVLAGKVLYENDTACSNCSVEIHSKVRKATTDENGIFSMPKVSQGIHEVVVYDEQGDLVLRDNIEIQTAPTPSVEGLIIRGKKSNEYLTMTLKASASKKILKIELYDRSILTVNYNGGTSSQSFEDEYRPNDEIVLIPPTRENYTFGGWNLSSDLDTSIINDNTLTLGPMETTISAKWVVTTDNYAYISPNQENENPYYEYVVPEDGWYQIEAWGAQGGNYNSTYTGGKGGYLMAKSIYLKMKNYTFI